MRFLRPLLWILGVAILAVLTVRVVLLPFMFWRLFRDSGYPWWIQVPAAVALAILFWMLGKRYKRGRFDGPF